MDILRLGGRDRVVRVIVEVGRKARQVSAGRSPRIECRRLKKIRRARRNRHMDVVVFDSDDKDFDPADYIAEMDAAPEGDF